MKVLFDYGILVDYLNGVEDARTEIEGVDSASRFISVLTWIQVLESVDDAHKEAVEGFLSSFTLLPVDTAVAEAATSIRAERQARLPDALLEATAQVGDALLVTRNTAAFTPAVHIRVPYTL